MSGRPRAGARYYKGHGLGNDYLIFEEGAGWTMTPGAVQRVCDRWKGVGGDGVVLVEASEQPDPVKLRMFNPDGGEFERSGNGLRIAAAFLYSRGRVADGVFHLQVGGDTLPAHVRRVGPGGVYDIEVHMGQVSFGPEAVGLASSAIDASGHLVPRTDPPVEIVPVSVGNPHAVVFGDEAAWSAFDRIGPQVAHHPGFARGTNVQLARIEEDRARILIWERGVGPTSASGTSACAVAAAGVRQGRLSAGPIKVQMEGGSFQVNVSDDFQVTLLGPVQAVAWGRLDAGFLEALGRS